MRVVNKILVAIGAALIITCAYQSCQIASLKSATSSAKAAHQAEVLASKGWRDTVSLRDLEAQDLRRLLAEAQEAGTRPVGGGVMVTGEVPVAIPLRASCPPPATPHVSTIDTSLVDTREAEISLVDPLPAPQLLLSSRVTLGITMLDDGKLLWKGDVTTRLRTPDDVWSQDFIMPFEDGEFAVAPDIERALWEYTHKPSRVALGMRRPRYWRTGWVVAMGCGVDQLGGGVACGPYLGYGLQF